MATARFKKAREEEGERRGKIQQHLGLADVLDLLLLRIEILPCGGRGGEGKKGSDCEESLVFLVKFAPSERNI